MSLDFQTINDIVGVDDSFKMPTVLMDIMFDKERREAMFREFLEYETDMSFDWFHIYYQEEYAERKSKKQDFTPNSIGKLLAELTEKPKLTHEMVHETACGTGGIIIQKWQHQRMNCLPFEYQPCNFFFQCEELSDRSIPFLLFNLLIRGMNATVLHGDGLEQKVKQIYFVQNDENDFMKFSDLNVLPHSEICEKEFCVKEWLEDEISHVESPNMFEEVS
ncbi:hypothetical protein TEHN7126_2235 [Tetragenococcus halophilus subsp. halophilus]|uniref:N-6 DNA methylase n=1 Tax=Tetragenococcus halophilus TaxID=51669 RepID=UPI000CBC583B|nr:N-6 DNA methylase [Tetragenococcus halophilus]GBD74222.1 hypothetical protein TEHN7125_2382 [Tetragenococcus halophilus subsp. halophilus]GBD76536.1 hypothetical protein TEHN7126_2235 [Tetragenococcus halophilus subsp. halophilus]